MRLNKVFEKLKENGFQLFSHEDLYLAKKNERTIAFGDKEGNVKAFSYMDKGMEKQRTNSLSKAMKSE